MKICGEPSGSDSIDFRLTISLRLSIPTSTKRRTSSIQLLLDLFLKMRTSQYPVLICRGSDFFQRFLGDLSFKQCPISGTSLICIFTKPFKFSMRRHQCIKLIQAISKRRVRAYIRLQAISIESDPFDSPL